MSRINEIINHTINVYDMEEDDVLSLINKPYNLAKFISKYAHRNDYRENGDEYYIHPLRVLIGYYRMLGIHDPSNMMSIDVELLKKYNIPYEGVEELCILHDVIEDTDFTIDELYELFELYNNGLYFNTYIRKPLELITHDKNVDYDKYIDVVMSNPTSSLVKMLDLENNSNPLTLSSLDDKRYKRCIRYLEYIYKINNKYHFIEKTNEYRMNVGK